MIAFDLLKYGYYVKRRDNTKIVFLLVLFIKDINAFGFIEILIYQLFDNLRCINCGI